MANKKGSTPGPTPGGQPVTGHRSKVVANPEKRTGRSDGTGHAQKHLGHLSEPVGPEKKAQGSSTGLQGNTAADLRRSEIPEGEINTVNVQDVDIGQRVGAQPISLDEDAEE